MFDWLRLNRPIAEQRDFRFPSLSPVFRFFQIGTACVISALPQPGSTAPPVVSGSLSESEDDDILSSSFKQRLCIMNLDHSDNLLHEGRDGCIIRQPPEGFFLASTETSLVGELASSCSQLIMQAFRVSFGVTLMYAKPNSERDHR